VLFNYVFKEKLNLHIPNCNHPRMPFLGQRFGGWGVICYFPHNLKSMQESVIPNCKSSDYNLCPKNCTQANWVPADCTNLFVNDCYSKNDNILFLFCNDFDIAD